MKHLSEEDEEELARGLLAEEKTASLARSRIDATIAFLQRVKNVLPEK